MEQETKLCLCCAHPVRGRSDKKFCSDYCRSAFHNRRIRRHNHHVRAVNRILSKNRSILAALVREGIRSVSVVYLEERGFKPAYCTSIIKAPNGRICRFCYEYGLEFGTSGLLYLRQQPLPVREGGCT